MYNLCQRPLRRNAENHRARAGGASAVRKLDHDQRRREIAEAAARLIAADGMAALTTRGLSLIHI